MMNYEYITVEPLTSALGAKVAGLNISEPLDDAVKTELHAAWLEYQVLFFRDQEMSSSDILRFSSIFGAAEILEFIPDEMRDPDVKEIEIFAQKDWGDAPPTDTYHIDVSSRPMPSKGAVLYAKEMPRVGGDTLWVNLYDAYDALTDPIKQLLNGRTASFPKMDFDTVERVVNAEKWMLKMMDTFAHEPLHHPLVHTHPETGRRALYFDPFRTRIIDGLSRDESAAIVGLLRQHVAKPEFQCRFNWQQGSACVWDNRCTLHKRVDDKFEGKRVFHRVSLLAETAPIFIA